MISSHSTQSPVSFIPSKAFSRNRKNFYQLTNISYLQNSKNLDFFKFIDMNIRKIFHNLNINSPIKASKLVLREYKYLNLLSQTGTNNILPPLRKSNLLRKLQRGRVKIMRNMQIRDMYSVSGNYNIRIYSRITPNFHRTLKNFTLGVQTFFRKF